MRPNEHQSDEQRNAPVRSSWKASDYSRQERTLRSAVRKRAYELYLARKGGPGSEVQDWLQAEAEVLWKLEH
jgi:hypothetical protein